MPAAVAEINRAAHCRMPIRLQVERSFEFSVLPPTTSRLPSLERRRKTLLPVGQYVSSSLFCASAGVDNLSSSYRGPNPTNQDNNDDDGTSNTSSPRGLTHGASPGLMVTINASVQFRHNDASPQRPSQRSIQPMDSTPSASDSSDAWTTSTPSYASPTRCRRPLLPHPPTELISSRRGRHSGPAHPP